MKILLTGFEPFGGESENPSSEAVAALSGTGNGHDIFAETLPTSYSRAPVLLKTYIARYEPDIIICTGQAGGRDSISLEFCALNIADASLPDNDGEIKSGQSLLPGKPNAYFTTVNLGKAAAAIREKGSPCGVSYHAGTFVCNAVYYTLLNICADTGKKGCFVHFPYMPEQTGRKKGVPCLPLSADIRALETLIDFLCN